MDKLVRIIIALFVLNNTLFELIALAENVRLNIIYFCLTYFCFFLLCLYELAKYNYRDSFSLLMGIGFTVRIIIELTKWNMPWKAYMVSISSLEQGLLFSFLTIALILITITHERRKHKDN